MRKRLLPFCMALIMAMTMTSTVAFAGTDGSVQYGTKANVEQPEAAEPAGQIIDFDHAQPKAVFRQDLDDNMQAATVTDDRDYLEVAKPKPGQTYYLGEKIKSKYAIYDFWDVYYSRADIYVYDSSGNMIGYAIGDRANENTWTTYKQTIPLSTDYFSTGNYDFVFYNVPCYEDGTAVDYWSNMNPPRVIINLNVRILNPPSSLRLVSRSGGRITITFPKAKGAGKYKIYRSTSVNGKYKCIKTTGKRKYVDTKVKKGTTYYYYVKSMRNKNGKILSERSSIWYVPAF